MHFTRTLQKHVTNTGTHYALSIPREIAKALTLQDGGLCRIELVYKSYMHKKGVKAQVVLMAYKDTPPLVTERFGSLEVS
jgi:glutamate formiminotransferase